MSWAQHYRSEAAFWVALRRRATDTAAGGRIPHNEVLRTYVMQRFMARMFDNPGESPWIVAGGTGLIIRVPAGRATRDIDLNIPDYTGIDGIRDELLEITGDRPDLDPFTFTLDPAAAAFTGGVRGSSWRITATIAGQRAAVFGLDLAADDTTPPSDIEWRPVTPAIPDMPGMPAPPPVPLFPLESQLADKISAITFRDETGRSTNRYRDLVDLALYAGHVDVDADKLRQALDHRARRRNHTPPASIIVPDGWAAGYRKTAAATNLPATLLTVEEAGDAVAAWLNPLLAGDLPPAARWDHHTGVWRTGGEPPHKPGYVWVRPHLRDGQPIIEHYRRTPKPRETS